MQEKKNCIIPLAVILNRSAVYVKGFDPKKIRGRKKHILSEQIKLWNIIANALTAVNTEKTGEYEILAYDDIIKYIADSKVLSSSIYTGDLHISDDRYIDTGDNNDVIYYIGQLVSKIDILFFTKNCDYKELFVYIRALHNLPKCFFPVNDKQRIIKTDAIAYMKNELRLFRKL